MLHISFKNAAATLGFMILASACSNEQVDDFFKKFNQQQPTANEEDGKFGDFVEDKTSLSPIDQILKSDLREQIDDVLSQLNEREKAVISMRFGLLEDESDRTLEEIGKALNVTRERVLQIEISAIKKLKHPKVGRKIKNYIEG